MSLVHKLVRKAEIDGIKEAELCRKIGMDHPYFTRWKKSPHLAPDMRKEKNKKIYRNISDYLKRPFAEVIFQAMFPNNRKDQEDFEKHHKERLILKPLSVQAKFDVLERNIPGNEEVLDLCIDLVKSYKKNILCEEWID